MTTWNSFIISSKINYFCSVYTQVSRLGWSDLPLLAHSVVLKFLFQSELHVETAPLPVYSLHLHMYLAFSFKNCKKLLQYELQLTNQERFKTKQLWVFVFCYLFGNICIEQSKALLKSVKPSCSLVSLANSIQTRSAIKPLLSIIP